MIKQAVPNVSERRLLLDRTFKRGSWLLTSNKCCRVKRDYVKMAAEQHIFSLIVVPVCTPCHAVWLSLRSSVVAQSQSDKNLQR